MPYLKSVFAKIKCHVLRAHLRSSASVAGNDVNRLYKRRLGQFPGECVLAATIANEEDTQLVVRHCESRVAGVVAKGMLCLYRHSPSDSRLFDSFGRSQNSLLTPQWLCILLHVEDKVRISLFCVTKCNNATFCISICKSIFFLHGLYIY
jgi:hypothetical protein